MPRKETEAGGETALGQELVEKGHYTSSPPFWGCGGLVSLLSRSPVGAALSDLEEVWSWLRMCCPSLQAGAPSLDSKEVTLRGPWGCLPASSPQNPFLLQGQLFLGHDTISVGLLRPLCLQVVALRWQGVLGLEADLLLCLWKPSVPVQNMGVSPAAPNSQH